MKQYFGKYLFISLFFGIIFIFFYQFFLQGLLPIPADTIVGLYHPFRDLFASTNPNGLPFHNFLITDPVRQIYPWKNLAVDIFKSGQLPLWNPYQMAGIPLLANFQSSLFYPLNILLFIFPFSTGWSLMIILQPILAGLFLYLYLRNQKLSSYSSLFGAVTFAFCGFSVAWMEWNTVVQTVLWLPLILLCIDEIMVQSVSFRHSRAMPAGRQANGNLDSNSKRHRYLFWIPTSVGMTITWSLVFLFSIIASFFAGHLQTFFYLYIIVVVYFVFRLVQNSFHGIALSYRQVGISRNDVKLMLLFLILNLCFLILTSIQWMPTLQFIFLSARNVDQLYAQPGWFIPWQNLIQFFTPDFFGNPATLNYWGVWNYGEFIGYIGILPLIFALYTFFIRRNKVVLFWGAGVFISLLFATPNPIAQLPFILHVPFLSTSQPTRLIFVTDFCLSILSALGFESFINGLSEKKTDIRKIIGTIGIVGIVFAGLWLFVLFGGKLVTSIKLEDLVVAKRNLIFPSVLFLFSGGILLLVSKLNHSLQKLALIILLIVSAFDLIRFGQKFETFSKKEYLYPISATIQFLQKNLGNYRIASTDSRIFPPNFATQYRIQSIEGYDPLYLLSYGELIAASERGQPNIDPPFGFNRIITPHSINSPIINLLGVKYILSLTDISSPQFKKVFQEGQTQVFENKKVFLRAFFVKKVHWVTNKDESIQFLFDKKNDLSSSAVYNRPKLNISAFYIQDDSEHPIGKISELNYSENKVIIKVQNSGDGFLVLTDSYYPTWKATIDGNQTAIYKSDYAFRGVFVPSGKHTIIFEDKLY